MTSQADSAPRRQPTREDLDLCGLSHPGRVRRDNQDHFLIASLHKTMQVHRSSLPEEALGRLTSPSRGYVFLVADGVGGTPGGKEVSRTALRAIVDYVVDAMDLYTDLEPEAEPAFLEELQRSPCATSSTARWAEGARSRSCSPAIAAGRTSCCSAPTASPST